MAGLGGIDKEHLDWLAGLDITDSAVVAALLHEASEHAQFDAEQINRLLQKFVAAQLQENRQ